MSATMQFGGTVSFGVNYAKAAPVQRRLKYLLVSTQMAGQDKWNSRCEVFRFSA